MTTKPSRTSNPNVVGELKLPTAMMTIPDFCWQPAMIARSGIPSGTPSSDREETPEQDSPPDSPQPLGPVTHAESHDGGSQSPEVARRERTGLMMIDGLRLKAGLRRHWMPVGGIAVALLWIASVLLSGGDKVDDQLAPEGPRQARRETTPRLSPLAKGQLRAPGREAEAVAPSLEAEVTPDSPSSHDGKDDLFERVPVLSGLPTDELPSAELPAVPALNPPSGRPATVDSAPDPAAAAEGHRPESYGSESSRPRNVEQAAPADAVPVADISEVPRRETEYEWGTPNESVTQSPPTREVARSVGESERPGSAAVSGDRAVSTGQPAYRQTDPASYKDPLYVIPPVARQPRASGYR